MLQPRGFEPSSLTVKPGPLQIRVYNRIGPRDLPLRLDRVDRDGQQQAVLTPLRQETLARQQRKWDNEFNLTAGQYRVSIEGQPHWTCTITVAPEAPR